jgi:hypothetical protein
MIFQFCYFQVYDFYKDEEGLQPFTMEHLKGAFFVYFGLNGIAILVVICEKMMKTSVLT